MISADVNADLTDTASWTRTNNVDKGSVLEGNPILGPDGKIWTCCATTTREPKRG